MTREHVRPHVWNVMGVSSISEYQYANTSTSCYLSGLFFRCWMLDGQAVSTQ